MGNDKTITVVVQHQPAFDFVAMRLRRLHARLGSFLPRLRAGCFSFCLAAWEPVAPARQLLDGATPLEFGEHFEERAVLGFLPPQAAPDPVARPRVFPP